MRYSFKNDYSELCNPEIAKAIADVALEQNIGYGEDKYCDLATKLIQRECNNPDCAVHFIPGGTQTNLIVISSILRPYEAVIAVDSGHINVHEAGAIEATGHAIIYGKNIDGKLDASSIAPLVKLYADEHMVKPGLVYISETTELGTVYSLSDLQEISAQCKKYGLKLFIDGARLGSALASETAGVTLANIAQLADVFYIGATKNGGMLGEAVVITNSEIKVEFRRNMKQRGALLAKGQLLGIQFYELFKDGLYYRNALHSNKMANKLVAGISELGYKFMTPPVSNQIFPILPNSTIEKLNQDYGFYVWTPSEGESPIRLVTCWATKEEMVDEFLKDLRTLTV